MKVIKTIEEDQREGLLSLMGNRITLFCMNYIYSGDLTGVNDVQVKIENPVIVYETGPFNDSKWKDAQALPRELFVRLSAVEAYGVLK